MNPIVGIGELLWDIYPDGRKVAGGAPFNFAFHCHQLGHPGVIVSRIGDDDLGRELREEVRRLGLSDEFIQTDNDHPTGTVQVTLDAAGVPTYTITENVAWDWLSEDARTTTLIHDAAAVCYGTLGQRLPNSAATIRWYLEVAQYSFQPLLFCDLNFRPPFVTRDVMTVCLEFCGWLKLTEEELLRACGDLNLFEGSSEQLLHQFRIACAAVCITRGENGCRVMSDHEGEFELPGVPARVIDTVGAGDAFSAAMVCLSQEGRSLRNCAIFANYYAARVCEHAGATPRIDRREVERAAFGK